MFGNDRLAVAPLFGDYFAIFGQAVVPFIVRNEARKPDAASRTVLQVPYASLEVPSSISEARGAHHVVTET
jgi:hypothetical protein